MEDTLFYSRYRQIIWTQDYNTYNQTNQRLQSKTKIEKLYFLLALVSQQGKTLLWFGLSSEITLNL